MKTSLDHQVGGDHYKKLTIQPIEFIVVNGLGFIEGSIVKYVTRYKFKNGIEDLRKVEHFINLHFDLWVREPVVKIVERSDFEISPRRYCDLNHILDEPSRELIYGVCNWRNMSVTYGRQPMLRNARRLITQEVSS